MSPGRRVVRMVTGDLLVSKGPEGTIRITVAESDEDRITIDVSPGTTASLIGLLAKTMAEIQKDTEDQLAQWVNAG